MSALRIVLTGIGTGLLMAGFMWALFLGCCWVAAKLHPVPDPRDADRRDPPQV